MNVELPKDGLTPHSYLYRFGDPMSGAPVWRSSPSEWNGQKPQGFTAMYTGDQVEAALAAAHATIHQLGENAAKAAGEYAAEVAKHRETLAVLQTAHEGEMAAASRLADLEVFLSEVIAASQRSDGTDGVDVINFLISLNALANKAVRIRAALTEPTDG